MTMKIYSKTNSSKKPKNKLYPASRFPIFLGSLLVLLFNYNVQAQSLDFNNSVPTDLMVCENSETFTVEFSNVSGGTLANLEILLNLPDGVEYVTGSISESSNFNVQEADVTDLTAVVFSTNDLSSSGTISFTFEAEANFDAYNGQSNGNIFANQTTVSFDGGTPETDLTDAYNILYPSLSITNVNPMSTTVFVGQTFTRTVTIVNGGYGSLTSFVLKDTYDSNLSLDAVDIGTLNMAGDEITFSSADFVGIGNGDGRLDQNESLVLTQTMTATGCNNTEDELIAYWGCDGQTSASNIKKPVTKVQLFAPSLKITSQKDFNTCVDGSADQQQLTILNEGTGPANEVEIEVAPKADDQYTRTDVTSITYTLNGNTVALTPTATQAAVAYACLGSNPKDGFTVTLPSIQPGETLTLNWDNYTCATEECSPVNLIGWIYAGNYTDMCASKTYAAEGNGQGLKKKNFSTFFESPSGLADGEIGTYTLTFNSAAFSLPEGDNPYFEAVFDIPNGLVWSGNAADLNYASGQNVWTASQIDFNSSSRTLTAKYDFPIPDNFTFGLSQFNLDLAANCAEGGGTVAVGMQLFYTMDSSCPNTYRMPMACKVVPQTMMQCPGSCDAGLIFNSFEIARTSFGTSDNNLDGLPDATSNLDMANVKIHRVMVGDTFETTFNGSVKTSSTQPNFGFGYARSFLPRGSKITVRSARVNILDKSTGLTLTCNNVPFTQSVSNDIRTVDYDFSSTTLASNGCSNFSGFVLEDEDEIELIAEYEITGNIGGKMEQLTIENDFYVTDVANGTPFKCTDDWSGNFTLIGYYFRVNKAEQYNVTTCTQTISQNYYLSIGKCCGNYAGGNIFPYEYRNWGNVKDLKIEIPAGYSFVSGRVEQWRTVSTSATAKETANISPTNINGTTHTFDLEQYLVSNGGTLNLSDDGFNGKVFVEVQPECTVNEALNSPVTWSFNFQENAFLGGGVTSDYSNGTDYVRYANADLAVSTTFPTQDGIAPTVSWDVAIKSEKAAAENAWMYFQDVTGNVVITEVEDLSDNSILTPVNGFYQTQNFSEDQTKQYRITASYTNCNVAEVKVITGYSCDGYATSLAAYNCAYEELTLGIDIQASELQVRYESAANPADECDNYIKVEIEMLSAKLGSVNDLFVNIIQPATQTMTIESGSVEVLYPLSGSYTTLADPVQQGLTYSITGTDMDADLATNGLSGVTDVTSNRVKLRFNVVLDNDYKAGEILNFQVGGARPCGDALPTLAIIFDPNANFGTPEGIGLDDVSDAWAASWGDYDNDGFVDLFVTNYDANTSNFLYHNDGDGSFTKVTTGSIATDMASSLAATWGDYDNNGTLDLFVANNIGSPNFLYRNDGTGNFTRIMNDPIVNDLGYAHGASWADYDNDGFLDMFVTDYFSTKFNHLYHNNGDGTFSEANSSAPTLEADFSVSAAWGDYNNDNYPDLFIANTDGSKNSLYKNMGNGNFLKINTGAIVNDIANSVGGSWGDYNNDGYLDLFVSNSGNGNNFLYQNNGDETFTKITSGVVVTSGGHSHGSAWADYDNDGDLDLFVANDQGQKNFFYSNNGDGTFFEIDNSITQDIGESFGAAWADYDNDGDIDLYVANHNQGENFIYENGRGRCQTKACVVLEGTSSNRSAIGTKIYVKANIYGQDVWQMREVSAQSGGGIGGQNELKTMIGLGDASIIDSMIIVWNSGYRQILTNQDPVGCATITEENASEICGIAYFDANGNCVQDNGETGIGSMNILVQPGNLNAITDETGAYSFMVPPGDYTVEEVTAGTNWQPNCGNSVPVTVVGINNQFCGNNIANSALCNLADLQVEVTTTPHRVGFENLVAITYRNVGAQTAKQVKLSATFDRGINLIESSIPWTTNVSNELEWDLGDVARGTAVTIYLKDSISADVVIGSNLEIEADLSSVDADCDVSDNSMKDIQPAVGAIDPNDILVNPEGYIDNDQELIYKIRFQNVGNASVSTVRIEDRLPLDLDLSTLQVGVASHNYRFEIQNGNRLVWTFENINMPDSLTNEPESHGFVTFKILPKADLVDGTTIENKASIFFDNVAPIVTNTVINIIGRPKGSTLEAGQLQIIPNPMVDLSTIRIISLEGVNVEIKSLFVYDLLGRELQQQFSGGEESLEVQRNQLAEGFYMVKALGVDGKEYTGKLMITNEE